MVPTPKEGNYEVKRLGLGAHSVHGLLVGTKVADLEVSPESEIRMADLGLRRKRKE